MARSALTFRSSSRGVLAHGATAPGSFPKKIREKVGSIEMPIEIYFQRFLRPLFDVFCSWPIRLANFFTSTTMPQTRPVVTYSALVGRLLARRRKKLVIKQLAVASAVGMSQSAYSRLERGYTKINIVQLRSICAQMGLRPSDILSLADDYAERLHHRNVDVI